MQNYIKQLIDDIHSATLRDRHLSNTWMKTGANPDNEAEREDLSYIEKYFDGEEGPISQITGINANLIPSAEKLSEEQRATLAIELEKLLSHYNFQLLFPENYPPHLKYPFIKEFWEEEHVALSFGTNEIELCDMDDETFCPFKGYCNNCNEMREQMKYDEECEAKYRAEHPNEKLFDWHCDIEEILPSKENIEACAKKQGTDNDTRELDEIFGSSENYDPGLDFIGGFFNDDGIPVDLDSIPIPGLCIICKSYHDEDQEENFLCLMNRNDQRNEPDFKCGAFRKI